MMTTPTLFSVPAFDADTGYTFKFNVIGGQQVIKNQLRIRNQSTDSVVYDETQETFELKHILAGNKLVNGTYYNAQIKTFGADGEASEWSLPIQFYCYTTPTLVLSNMPLNNIVQNSIYTFEAAYSQAQGEVLNIYRFNLYDSAKLLIATSNDRYYGQNVNPPTTVSYTFDGFSDDTFYYLECIATTVNGTIVSTGLVPFTVNYVNPNIYAVVTLENNACKGWIKITSNVVLIEGHGQPDPPKFIDDKEVDLRDDGSKVTWNDGFNINGNFSMGIWGRDFNEYTKIMEMFNPTASPDSPVRIEFFYMLGYETSTDEDMKAYILCNIYSGSIKIPYTVRSNYIPVPDGTEQLFIYFRRKNNMCDLTLKNRGAIV